MPTPSGTIGLSDVNAELGFSPTALISMNDAAVRTLAGVPSGVISMQNLQNKSNRVVVSLTISANTYNYNAYTAVSAQPTYDAGKTDATITINPGITVGSTSTGTYAFSVPSSFNPGDTVTVVNNGTIIGRGGNGGTGGFEPGPPSNPVNGLAGGSGGVATLIQRPTIITNNGTIAGGGGGGGGGGSHFWNQPSPPEVLGFQLRTGGSGGGGGAGFDGGSGGSGGTASGARNANEPGAGGSAGTSPAGGAGGPSQGANPNSRGGAGGAGGGRGNSGSTGGSSTGATAPQGGTAPRPGSPGGGAGAYINGFPFVTFPATGTRLGPSS